MSDDLEDLLPLYVNGRATAEERRRVESATASDPVLAQRLAFMRHIAGAVSDADTAASATDWSPGDLGYRRLARDIGRERDAKADAARWRLRSLAGGALAVAGLAAGVFLGARLQPSMPEPTTPGWRMSAAVYQRLYSQETFASAPVSPEDRQAGLQRLSDAVGLDLTGLEAPSGYRLQRVEILSFNGRALGQVAYLDSNDVPVSLCLMRRGDSAPDDLLAPTETQILDMNGVDWRTADHQFLLIGGSPAVAGLGAAEDQRVHVMGALIGVDRFQVRPCGRITWNSSEIPLPPCMSRACAGISSALPQLLRLTIEIISGAAFALVEQGGRRAGRPAARARSRSACRRASSGKAACRPAACRTACGRACIAAPRASRTRPRPARPRRCRSGPG